MEEKDFDYKPFIYVLNREYKETLLSLGFELLNSDNVKDVYIFINDNNVKTNLDERYCFISDILVL